MKSILILLTIHYSLFMMLNAASVDAVVSEHEVVQGNPVQLKIVAKGEKVEFPQISTIGGVPVEGHAQTHQTSLQSINGKSTVAHTTNFILTFTPKKDVQIPSYTVKIDGKAYKTKPIAVKVVKSTAPKSLNDQALALVMKADKHEVIVGEPVVVSVYFSVRNDIRLSDNPQYNRPSFKGFFVKEVGEPKSYMKGDHQVSELRYILIPEKEGHYVLEPATVKVALLDTSRRDMFGRFFGSTWKTLRSNTFDINVKPAPQDVDLIGRFYIESSIDKTETKANKPVNLTVTIKGDGSLEDYEMPNYDIDGVTVYSDDAEVTTKVIGDKLKSTYVKKFVFISDHDFKIPARTLTSYDPQSKTVKTLKIPAYSIKVKASHHTAAVPSQGKANSDTHSGEIQTDIKLSDTPSASKKVLQTPLQHIPAGWMLISAFAAGMLTFFLFSKFSWRPKAPIWGEKDALKVLYAHMSEDPKVEAMVRKLYAKKNGQKDVIIDKKELKALMEKYAK